MSDWMKKTKLGKDLAIGDKIIIANEARAVTVTHVCRGMVPRTKMVTWGDPDFEWSSVPFEDVIELAD